MAGVSVGQSNWKQQQENEVPTELDLLAYRTDGQRQ